MLCNYSADFGDYMRRSSPSLDPYLRQLIDEAVAAGRVKVIPPGTSSAPQYRWSERENRIVSDDNRTQAEKAKHRALSSINSKQADQARRRREEIEAMHRGGMTAAEIAQARGESVINVRKIIVRIEREGAVK